MAGEQAASEQVNTCDRLIAAPQRNGIVAPALTVALQQRRKTILGDRKRVEDKLALSEPSLHYRISP